MASTGVNRAGTIWDQVLARIETKVNQHIYATWFKPTTFVSDNGALVHVRVPNALFSNWLTKHYSVVLEEALAEVNRHGCAISFVTDGEIQQTKVVEPPVPVPDDINESQPGSLAPRYSFDAFIVG